MRGGCSLLLIVSCLGSAFLALAPLPASSISQCKKPPIIFNFGDSNSDTGGLAAALAYPINPPYGRSFFRRSTGRLCDGRLLIDFLCQDLKTSLLSPYLDSLDSEFTNGVNFAIAGSSTLPKYLPFALNIQVMQFLHFRARSLELNSAGSKILINDEGFRNALYMIDIGQNDLADSFSKKMSFAQVVKRIPSVVSEIRSAIETLYNSGARKFWIHNTGPLGCLPQKLSLARANPGDVDSHGCLTAYNEVARLFNEGLLHSCQQIRSKLKDATVVYVDIYSIKSDLIANPAKYGFSSPLSACCGFGGAPYNYNVNITCGQPMAHACDGRAQTINWDGIHYTEAANAVIASKVLSTTYSTPRVQFDFFCQ